MLFTVMTEEERGFPVIRFRSSAAPNRVFLNCRMVESITTPGPIAAMLALRLIINFEGPSRFSVQKHVEDPLLIVFERFGGLSATGKLSQEVPAICETSLIHALDEVK